MRLLTPGVNSGKRAMKNPFDERGLGEVE